jgi:hypothetical protein
MLTTLILITMLISNIDIYADNSKAFLICWKCFNCNEYYAYSKISRLVPPYGVSPEYFG